MRVVISACSSKGTRDQNDDRVLVVNEIVDDGFIVKEIEGNVCFAVCDGCGGYSGGYLAALTVLENLQSEVADKLLDEEYLRCVLRDCSEKVTAKQQEYSDFSSMCTTVAGVVLGDMYSILFYAGDSRIYRFDGKYFAKMSSDHSLIQQLIDNGELSYSEAGHFNYRNVITRCIGILCSEPEIKKTRSPLLLDETFVICSDGVWAYVSEDEFIDILSEDIDFKEKARKLISCAIENGSDDNVSVCLCTRIE